jgi:hypothetical protein
MALKIVFASNCLSDADITENNNADNIIPLLYLCSDFGFVLYISRLSVLLDVKIGMNLAHTEKCKWYGYEEYRESSEVRISRSLYKIAEKCSRILKLVVNSKKRFYEETNSPIVGRQHYMRP